MKAMPNQTMKSDGVMRLWIAAVLAMYCLMAGIGGLIPVQEARAALPNPVAAYSFDEGSGTTVLDSSGNGNNGTLVGATWTNQGEFGSALVFNGAGNMVKVNNSASLGLTNGMTIDAWVYPTVAPAGWSTIVTKEIPGDGVYTLYASNASNNRPYIGLSLGGGAGTAFVNGTAQLAANTWTHVAATYDGTTLILYINGTQVAATTAVGGILTSSNPLVIGGSEFLGEYFQGRIDNLRIFNQALSAANVAALKTTAVTLPTVLSISQPVNGTAVSGANVNVSYAASGNLAGVDHASFQLDGGAAVSDTTFDGVFQLTNVPYGPHTLTGYLALADNTKISGSDSTVVTFNNTNPADPTPPTINITLPVDGSLVSGTASVQATAFDNIAVAGVQFYLDGNPLGTEITSATSLFQYSWNTIGTTDGSHTLTARARDTGGNIKLSTPVMVTVGNASNLPVTGQWGSVMPWPLVTVHSTLMYTGEVLVWDAWEVNATAKTWNPVTGVFTEVPSQFGLFCSAMVQMPDGKILTVGGHDPTSGNVGIQQTNIFDPLTKTWTQLANMSVLRWYPSANLMPDGTIVAISGESTPGSWSETPGTYNPTTNAWTLMTGVSTSNMHDDNYPLTHLLPSGLLFSVGTQQVASGQGLPSANGVVRTLDVTNKVWANLGATPTRDGSMVMYRPGKFLLTGGGTYGAGNPTVASSYVMDMTVASPSWRAVQSMAFGRYFHNLTILADGTVFAVGGSTTVDTQAQNGATAGEIWNPATETWTTVASMHDWRNYHSTAILMPDGRVLVAGGGRLGSAPNFLTAEYFSPPYLFKGSRPTISSAPTATSLGATFTIQTPDAASIASVALVPLPSLTHTLDGKQTYLQLSFTAGSGQIQATMPTNANLALPGYYMLFILNTQGVPSVAPFIRVQAPGTDSIAPSIPGTLTATGAAGSASLSWGAATDNVGVVLYNVYRSTTSGFTPSTANRIGQPSGLTFSDTNLAAGTYYYKVTAQDLAGNAGPASNQASAVVTAAPDTQPPTAPVLSATGSSTASATANWTAATDNVGVVQYNLYRSTTSGFVPAVANLIAQTANLFFNDTNGNVGLSPGTYYYLVTAQDATGNVSPVSNQASAVVFLPDTTPPTVPANPQLTVVSSSAINFTWTASTDTGGSGVSGYRIYRGPAANSLAQVGTSTTTSYPDTGLAASTTYFYAVAAVDVAGNVSNQTTPVSAATQAQTGFNLGTTTIGTITDSGYANTMSALRYSTGAGQSGAVSSISVYIPAPIGAAPGNQFQVAIYTDVAGAPGALVASSAAQAITAAGWNTVPITATLSASTAYWLVYNTNATASANNSLRLTSGGTFVWRGQTFGTWPASFGATQGTAAYFASIYATVGGAPPDTTLPSIPGTLTATGGTGTASLNWGAATDNVGVALYNVYRSTTSGFTPAVANRIAQPVGLTYNDTGLAAGTYYYKVAAQDAAGNIGPASNQASAIVTAIADTTPPTVPASPQLTVVSSSAITFSWTASTDTGGSGVSGYRIYRGPAANSLVQVGTSTTTSYPDSGLTASTTYFYAVAAVDVAGNVSNQTTPISAATQSASSFKLGTTTVGTISDSGYANTMSALRYTTGAAQSGTVSSISVYIPAPIGASPGNQFQAAIYTDAGGAPGALVASSVSQSISAAGWTTVPIAASLSANTAYWLVYNTNATASANNSLILTNGGTFVWRAQTFGTWPATFGAVQGSAPYVASIYATVN